MTRETEKGFVYLVGAGPGRPDLITIRGVELLRQADCVIWDKLVHPSLLNYAPAGAEIIHTPKRAGAGSFTQEQINKLLIEKAVEGKVVVRLKGGDPCIFGRGAEEAAALAEAGVDFEIVPGVTAGIAAGEYAGIMLTDRRFSSQVVFVTGQEAEGKEQSSIDWDLLAKFRGTIVFYMGMGNLDFIVEQLIRNDMDEQMPAAVIADATTANQRMVQTELCKLGQKCKQEKIEAPAIVIIGKAAEGNPQLNWFMRKPLFGKNIVVTRDRRGNADFAARIISEGGNPLIFDAIRIEPLTKSGEFLKAIVTLKEYDWIIFTSANGVNVFFEAVISLGGDARVFGAAKVAAIGSETAEKLSQFGIKADFVPSEFTSQQLAKQLAGFANLKNKDVLLLRSDIASSELAELLEKTKAKVLDVPVYSVVTERSDSKWLIEKIVAGKVHWLTFCSPSSVRGFFEQIPAEMVKSSSAKTASIGPVTSEELKKLGIKVDIEAAEHTIGGLINELKRFCAGVV